MILVFAESKGGKFKKNAFEIVELAKRMSEADGTEIAAVVLGESDQAEVLGNYGAKKVYHADDSDLNDFNDYAYRDVIAGLASKLGASHVLLSHTAVGKALAGRLAVKLDAACISGINDFNHDDSGFEFVKPVFSGKAFARYRTDSEVNVISLMPNSLQFTSGNDSAEVEKISPEFQKSKVKIVDRNLVKGKVPLPEAELVVSAGRGMKGPENWDIIEELAETLGATTACSRPVADSEWRPHHEHVGQTGVAIRPNLYLAIGISGAIQHLAGVNNSKVIVVINKDPEAPFFKAADYGVCADLFEVVPKLTEAVKRFKENN